MALNLNMMDVLKSSLSGAMPQFAAPHIKQYGKHINTIQVTSELRRVSYFNRANQRLLRYHVHYVRLQFQISSNCKILTNKYQYIKNMQLRNIHY